MSQGLGKKIEEAIKEALRRFQQEQEDPHFLVLDATGAGCEFSTTLTWRISL